MKKPNLVIGKKQIVLACLTLMLGIAIYVNYALSAPPAELTPTSVYDGAGLNYGDVAFVSAGTSDDFFAQARLDKMTSRDKAIETLQSIFGGGDITEDEKSVITQNAVSLSQLVESEGIIENLIKAAGFEDCVVYLDGESAKIVVKSDGLVASQVAQIKDILLSEVAVENENIRIFDKK